MTKNGFSYKLKTLYSNKKYPIYRHSVKTW